MLANSVSITESVYNFICQQLSAEVASLVAECSADATNSGNDKYQWLINRLRKMSEIQNAV